MIKPILRQISLRIGFISIPSYKNSCGSLEERSKMEGEKNGVLTSSEFCIDILSTLKELLLAGNFLKSTKRIPFSKSTGGYKLVARE